MSPALRRGQLHSKQGYNLLELAILFALMGIVLASVSIIGTGMIKKSKAKKVLMELNTIAESCRQFYSTNSAWPLTINDLYPDFIKTNNFINAFGNPYSLTSNVNSISISSDIPKGLINAKIYGDQIVVIANTTTDTITTTRLTPEQGLSTLKYDKKYLYNQ